MSVTAKQLAKSLGISEATVSLALRDKPGVSARTRKRVLEAALSLGYAGPAQQAPQVISTGRVHSNSEEPETICLIGYSKHRIFDHEHLSEVASGVEKGIKDAGKRLIVTYIDSLEELDHELDTLLEQPCGGVIILSTEVGPSELRLLEATGLPTVMLGSYLSGARVDSVTPANRGGAYLATSYLIEHFGVMPGFLKSRIPTETFDERADGYFMALREHGLPASESIIHILNPTLELAQQDMTAILNAHDKLARCYFADNDTIAMGALKAFTEQGYRLPEDVGIIGFGDNQASPYTEPPLSTVRIPSVYLGEMAAQRLIQVMEGGHFEPIRITVAATLVERGSTR